MAKENQITRQVTETLKEGITNEASKFEEYQTTLKSLQLLQQIETTHYSGSEVLPYLKNVHIPLDTIENTRFTCAQLASLYEQMRYNTPLDVLDS